MTDGVNYHIAVDIVQGVFKRAVQGALALQSGQRYRSPRSNVASCSTASSPAITKHPV
jgi:hypothetical protein